MSKFLDLNGLDYFWDKIVAKITTELSNKADKIHTLLGQFNDADPNNDYLLMIGNGTDENNTNTVFSVDNDGDVNSDGGLVAGGWVHATNRFVVHNNPDNFGAIRFASENRDGDFIQLYGAANGDGDGVVIGNGGIMIVGAGESATNWWSRIQGTADSFTTNATPGSEQLFLTSDNSVTIVDGANTVANRGIAQFLVGSGNAQVLLMKAANNSSVVIDTNSSNNGVSSATVIGSTQMQDKNGTPAGTFLTQTGSSGEIWSYMNAKNKTTGGSDVTNSFGVCVKKDGTVTYYVTHANNFRSAIGCGNWADNTTTVLYNNTTGTTGTVSLSASSANYNHMRIFYGAKNSAGTWLGYGSVDVFSPNGKSVTMAANDCNSTCFYTYYGKGAISAAQITRANKGYGWIENDDQGMTNTSNIIYIVRVEAWNE